MPRKYVAVPCEHESERLRRVTEWRPDDAVNRAWCVREVVRLTGKGESVEVVRAGRSVAIRRQKVRGGP